MKIIRRATKKETQQILQYALQVMKESTFGHVKHSLEKAHQLANEFLYSGGYYLVYIENNTIHGWVGLGTSYDLYNDKQVGFLYEIYVLPAFRNKGIAMKLCNKAIQQLERAGFTTIQLNVFAGNHVKKLCEKLGFKEMMMTMQKE